MEVINGIVALQNALYASRKAGKRIGLVPTMGALHEGHASLIRQSVKDCDVTVVSVFLNPTQFNDQNDLARYPKTLEVCSIGGGDLSHARHACFCLSACDDGDGGSLSAGPFQWCLSGGEPFVLHRQASLCLFW